MSDKPETGKDKENRDWLDLLTPESMLPWEMLPDIGLYMDQVLTLVDRQLSVYTQEEKARILTSAMVNNYIKDGLLPRAEAKKYAPEHLAQLLMIGALKQVMSISDLRRMLASESGQIRSFYQQFLAFQETSFSDTVELIRQHSQRDLPGDVTGSAQHLRELALKLSVEARTNVLAAQRALDMAETMESSEESGAGASKKDEASATAKRAGRRSTDKEVKPAT